MPPRPVPPLSEGEARWGSSRRDEKRQGWGWYGLATAAFVLALLAKPSAVIVPALAWIMAWGLEGAQFSWRRYAPTLGVWVAVGLAWTWLSRSVQPVPPELMIPVWQRGFVAGDALTFYLEKLVWPVRLGMDYGRTPAFVLAHGWGYVTGIVPVSLAIGLWMARRRWPVLSASGALFGAALLPVLGLVPFAFQNSSTVGDRYVYLAMLGPALVVAWLLPRIPRRHGPFVVGLGLGAGLLLCLQCALQVQYWQDDLTLFTHALAVNPRSWVANNNLGTTLYDLGHTEQAITAFQNSLRENPRQIRAWNNLGGALNTVSRLPEATAALQQALRLDPNYPSAYNNLGLVATDQGQLRAAEADFRRALELAPDFPEAENNLGVVSGKQGNWPAAAVHFRQALALRPGYANAAHNLKQAVRNLP